MNSLSKRLVAELKGTQRSLLEVCEDLGIDYEELLEEELPINRCNHCGTWSLRLTPDLDGNLICRFCVDLVGM